MKPPGKRVAMFVFNTGNGDQRVHRQATALVRAGYAVRIYCFLQPGLPHREERAGYTIVREDQRGRLTRFFDDQVLGRFKRAKTPPPAESVAPVLPEPRAVVRPCPPPAERHLPAQATDRERGYWAYVREINRIWAEQAAHWRPDVCQAHDLDALEGATLAARHCGARLVYDSHELWSDQPFIRSQEAVDYWNRLEAELIAGADAVLTVSEPFARVMEERYHVKVQPVHNCQELSDLDPGLKGRLRERSGGRPVALYQGVYGLDRGLEELVASAHHQSEVAIAMRGYGEREAYLRALAADLPHVIFLDPVPSAQVVAAAAEADVGVIPFLPTCLNHYWNTPNKLFEFMMAGLPIAASDLPDLRRFVEGERMGALFDPYCPEDVARCLVELARSPELAGMGERAHQACRRRWHWEKESEALLGCYQRLTAGTATPGSVSP